jgi:hypothetical protein
MTIKDFAPILAVAKDTLESIDQDSVLIPDWMNLENWPRLEPRMAHANKNYPWSRKSDTVFWHGGIADVSGYRHKITALSANMHHQGIDAQFTYGGKGTDKFLQPEDHLKYKFQLTIDGHTAAWERPVWQLYSNSVMVKQHSHLNQWYYPALQADKHYIDVGTEPQEVLSILSQYNEEQLKAIAHEGHLFEGTI